MVDYEQTKQEALKLVLSYGLTQHEICVLKDVYPKYLGKLVFGQSAEDTPPTEDTLQKLDKLDRIAIELIEICKRTHVLFVQAYHLAEDIRYMAQHTPLTEDNILRFDAD